MIILIRTVINHEVKYYYDLNQREPLFQKNNAEDIVREATIAEILKLLLPDIILYTVLWSIASVLIFLWLGNLEYTAYFIGLIALSLAGLRISTHLEIWHSPLGYLDTNPGETTFKINATMKRYYSMSDIVIGLIIALIIWFNSFIFW